MAAATRLSMTRTGPWCWTYYIITGFLKYGPQHLYGPLWLAELQATRIAVRAARGNWVPTGELTLLDDEEILEFTHWRADWAIAHYPECDVDSTDLAVWSKRDGKWLLLPKQWWIIKGVHNEYHPCDPEMFWGLYEKY